jgi:hypothetical protein
MDAVARSLYTHLRDSIGSIDWRNHERMCSTIAGITDDIRINSGSITVLLEHLLSPSLRDLSVSSAMPLKALLESGIVARSKCQLKTLTLTWGTSIANPDLTNADTKSPDSEIDLTCNNLIQLLTYYPSITDIAFSCSLQKVLKTGVFTRLESLKLRSVTVLRTMAAEDLQMVKELRDLRPGIQVIFVDNVFFTVYNPLW